MLQLGLQDPIGIGPNYRPNYTDVIISLRVSVTTILCKAVTSCNEKASSATSSVHQLQ